MFGKAERGQKPPFVCQNSYNLDNSIVTAFWVTGLIGININKMG